VNDVTGSVVDSVVASVVNSVVDWQDAKHINAARKSHIFKLQS
jgi:hypothetical protein